MDREHTCCFTGHRPEKLPWGRNEANAACVQLKKRLTAALHEAYGRGMRHFICGMARGADFYFCEAALALREECPDVTVEAAVPFEGQAERWRTEERERYDALLGRCDRETLIQHHYDQGCMLRRNRYMVDHAQELIAVYDGRMGGTMYTIRYAMKEGLRVTLLEV